jgi:hypothetical protein
MRNADCGLNFLIFHSAIRIPHSAMYNMSGYLGVPTGQLTLLKVLWLNLNGRMVNTEAIV